MNRRRLWIWLPLAALAALLGTLLAIRFMPADARIENVQGGTLELDP
jgi:hypothetical protein